MSYVKPILHGVVGVMVAIAIVSRVAPLKSIFTGGAK
jgi:hypothetical protein